VAPALTNCAILFTTSLSTHAEEQVYKSLETKWPMDELRLLLLTLGGGLQHVVEVYHQLNSLQLEVLEGGNTCINGVRVVGKGTNSVVFKCKLPQGVLS
jgi:hypothetical protein